MPKAKKTAKKRTKKPTDSEEEWDAKPLKRKVAGKKKKATMTSMAGAT
jgi:hypothetical protein